MELYSFCFYTLAMCAILWGVFGLRLSLSVLLANTVLGFVLFGITGVLQSFAGITLSSNMRSVLLLLYPLYWILFFALCKALDRINILDISLVARLGIGFTLCFLCIFAGQWGNIASNWAFFKATYLTDPAQRPTVLQQLFARSDDDMRCRSSHADLLLLALEAKDAQVVEVLLHAFAMCPSPSRTTQDTIKPMIDQGDTENIDFLMEHGMKPSTPIVADSGKTGSILTYAALTTDNTELVKHIALHDPQDARHMPDLERLILTLSMRNRAHMLTALREAEIIP